MALTLWRLDKNKIDILLEAESEEKSSADKRDKQFVQFSNSTPFPTSNWVMAPYRFTY